MSDTNDYKASGTPGSGYNDDVVKKLLAFEPSTVAEVSKDRLESTLFANRSVKEQAEQVVLDRKSIVYKAKNDSDTGDTITLNGREFRFSGRGFSNFLYYAGLRGGAPYFLNSFDVATRQRMIEELVERANTKNLKWFYYEEQGKLPYIVNMVPEDRPVISDVDFLLLVESTMKGMGAEAKIDKFWNYDGKIVVDIVTPDREIKVPHPKLDDVTQMGARLSNSQHGFSATDLETFMKRLICLNGMTALSKRRSTDKLEKDAVSTKDGFITWIRDGIISCFADYEYLQDKANEAVKEKADPSIFLNIIRTHKLNRAVATAIDSAMAKEPGNTTWHVANAITRAAHEGGFEAPVRLMLEEIGGHLVYA